MSVPASRLAAFLALAVVTAGCARRPAALCPRCNIVLISIDTLRADHVGAYGYQRQTTPNIDRLAAQAILFERAVSQSAWTRPAHASMFTGLYPHEHGILSVHPPRGLEPSARTIAAVLAEAGYQTAAFTGGGNMSAEFGFGVGFAVYRSPGRRFEQTVAAALEWLGEAREPFFLFVHGLDVHRPYKPTAADRRALGLSPVAPADFARACHGDRSAPVGPLVDQYDAAVHRADRSLGPLLKAVTEGPRAERTIVVVTADHGEQLREHGGCFHIRTLYREVIEVPLIVRVPGLGARRVAGVVPASVAVAPTLAELVLGRRGGLPGPTLVPVLAGGKPRFDYVVSETAARATRTAGGRLVALTGNYDKLIRWIDRGRIAYYDLVADPGEKRPSYLAPRASELGRWLEDWRIAHPRRLGVSAPMRPTARLKKDLRALGYLN